MHYSSLIKRNTQQLISRLFLKSPRNCKYRKIYWEMFTLLIDDTGLNDSTETVCSLMQYTLGLTTFNMAINLISDSFEGV